LGEESSGREEEKKIEVLGSFGGGLVVACMSVDSKQANNLHCSAYDDILTTKVYLLVYYYCLFF